MEFIEQTQHATTAINPLQAGQQQQQLQPHYDYNGNSGLVGLQPMTPHGLQQQHVPLLTENGDEIKMEDAYYHHYACPPQPEQGLQQQDHLRGFLIIFLITCKVMMVNDAYVMNIQQNA